jgi:chemotaxis protein MotB
LLSQLDAKGKALAIEQERLNKSAQAARIRIIDCQRSNNEKLKETLSNALNSFEGKGLTVEQKNGKVYVSMENKLLFNSGSWAVGSEGKKAVVELGKYWETILIFQF